MLFFLKKKNKEWDQKNLFPCFLFFIFLKKVKNRVKKNFDSNNINNISFICIYFFSNFFFIIVKFKFILINIVKVNLNVISKSLECGLAMLCDKIENDRQMIDK